MNFSLFNKLAFIANLVFLTALIMRIYPFMQGTNAESLVLVTGLVISPILNIMVTLNFMVQWYRGAKPYADFVQVFNCSALGIQIILFLFFSGWLPLSNINP